MRWRLLTLLAALAAAGCALGGGTPSPSPARPSASPPLAQELGISCAGGPVFHPALLDQAGRAETDQDAAAEALRAQIREGDGGGIPATGWIRVAETGDRVQFLAPASDGRTWFVARFAIRDGAWRLDAAGECSLELAPREGASRADWWLDPAFPAPQAGDRTLRVLVQERACASGEDATGRIAPPFVQLTPTEVRVAIFVRPKPGGQDCQGVPPTPFELELPEPLGQRALIDVGVHPPREPVAPGG